jgi:D-alanyl-D-alanine dipeptidase
MDVKTYFEAMSIYQDITVNLQYAELHNKTHEQIIQTAIEKYGKPKIAEAIRLLCKELDEKRELYLTLLKLVNMVEAK